MKADYEIGIDVSSTSEHTEIPIQQVEMILVMPCFLPAS